MTAPPLFDRRILSIKTPFFLVVFFTALLTVFTTLFAVHNWTDYNYDPSYPFLYNTIDLLEGRTVVFIAQPGVALYWIYSALLLPVKLLLGTDFEGFVFSNPEWAIAYLKLVLKLILLISVAAFARRWRFEENPATATLALALPLLNLEFWPYSNGITSEFLSLVIMQLVTLIMLDDRHKQNRFAPFLLGILAATLVLIKYTNALFPVLMLLFLDKSRLKIFLLTAVVTGLILLIPFYEKMFESFKWTFDIMLYGDYGVAPIVSKPISSSQKLYNTAYNGFYFLVGNPIMPALFVLLTSSLFRQNLFSKLSAGVLLTGFYTVFILFQGKPHYLHLISASLGFILLGTLHGRQNEESLPPKYIYLVLLLALAGAGISVIKQTQFRKLSLENAAYFERATNLISDKNAPVVYTFRTSSPFLPKYMAAYYSDSGNFKRSGFPDGSIGLLTFNGRLWVDYSKWTILYNDGSESDFPTFLAGKNQVFVFGSEQFLTRKSTTKIPADYRITVLESIRHERFLKLERISAPDSSSFPKK